MTREVPSGLKNIAVQPLFRIDVVNMNITTDQIATKLFRFNRYLLTDIRFYNASGSLTTAAGGVYNAITKPAGGILVAAAQAYSALTGATLGLDLTLTALAKGVQTGDLVFSLTTAQGSAMTASMVALGMAFED